MADASNHGSARATDPFGKEIIISPAESLLDIDPANTPPGELRQSFSRLLLLYDLGGRIHAKADEGDILKMMLDAVSEMLNVERAFVAVLAAGRLQPRTAHNIDLTGAPADWPVSSTMLRRVLDDGVSLLAIDALHDAQFGEAASVDLHNIRSVMCCPLGRRHKPKGLIYVTASTRGPSASRTCSSSTPSRTMPTSRC